jgi:hypothetical protein
MQTRQRNESHRRRNGLRFEVSSIPTYHERPHLTPTVSKAHVSHT